MGLLEHADIGGSEFAGMMWGGCGWEFLAAGVPMLHQLNDSASYISEGGPLAPFFNVHSPADISAVLQRYDRAALRERGARARSWFDQHHGSALAQRYVTLLRELAAR